MGRSAFVFCEQMRTLAHIQTLFTCLDYFSYILHTSWKINATSAKIHQNQLWRIFAVKLLRQLTRFNLIDPVRWALEERTVLLHGLIHKLAPLLGVEGIEGGVH
jgi:hypothetical protein